MIEGIVLSIIGTAICVAEVFTSFDIPTVVIGGLLLASGLLLTSLECFKK